MQLIIENLSPSTDQATICALVGPQVRVRAVDLKPTPVSGRIVAYVDLDAARPQAALIAERLSGRWSSGRRLQCWVPHMDWSS